MYIKQIKNHIRKNIQLASYALSLLFIILLQIQFTFAQLSNSQLDDEHTIIPEDIVKLRINFVLLKNDKGQGGWDEDNDEHMNVINGAKGWMNGYLSTNGKIRNVNCYGKEGCYPKRSSDDYSYIKDTKIRFEVGQIISVDDSKYWNNWDCQDFQDDKENPVCPENGLQYRCPNDEYSGNWYLNPLSQKINRDPAILPAINIFFTEDGEEYIPYIVNKDCSSPRGRFRIQDCSERPEESIDKEQRVHMRSQFLKYSHLINCKVCEDEEGEECQFIGTAKECCVKAKMTNNIIDGLSRALLHELGHTVDFSAGHCALCPGEGLMHATSPGRSLHPAEIKNAHKNIRTTNLMRYVISDKPIIIENANQNWKRFLNLHKDYIIRNGKSLTISNELNILDGNKVVIENGNVTIGNEAIVTVEADAGIVVQNGSSLTIKSGAILNINEGGKIVVKCGGILNIEEGVGIKHNGLDELYEYPCNELIGPSILSQTPITYHLPFTILEEKVVWTVFPDNRVNYTTHQNSITISPIQDVEGNILVKASFKPPHEDLWSTKLIWLGENEQLYNFVKVTANWLLFQTDQINQHVGLSPQR